MRLGLWGGGDDLLNYSYSAQRTFRNSDRVQWIAPRKIYSLYKARPTYFLLNESAYDISRVNGSQELEETVSTRSFRVRKRPSRCCASP
ncbi:MAG: hypothetical protein RL077_2342 [Verrucomicrobiota bacterium]